MATVATLLVNLTARTAAFQKKMRTSAKTVKEFSMKATARLKTMASAFKIATVAAAGLAVGLSYLVRNALATIDRIAKMSTELGISTEALTGWEHAAKITGSSLKDLHKGLQIFTRRMGEASQGYGEGKKGLEALGIEAEKFAKLKVEDSFVIIAEKISKLENVTDKVSVAFSLFGRQGVQMLNTLNLGAEGIRALEDEARQLGITFDNIQARRIEDANDAITRMRAAIQGVINQLTIQLAPIIEFTSEMFVEWAKNGGNGAKAIQEFLEPVVKIATNLLKIGEFITGIFQVVIGLVGTAIGLVAKIIGGIIKLVSLAAKITGFKEVAEDIKAAAKFTDDFANETLTLSDEIGMKGMEKTGLDVLFGMENEEKTKTSIADMFKEFEKQKKTAEDRMKTQGLLPEMGLDIGGQLRGGGQLSIMPGLVNVPALGSSLADNTARQNANYNKQTAVNTSGLLTSIKGMELY